MLKRLFILFVLTVLSISGGYAQKTLVKGVVSDTQNDTPLPGVNIILKGTSLGTVTDIDGNFKIEALPTDVLVVSYIGYKVQEILVGSQVLINVDLEVDYNSLEEVVVVGYGQMKRSDVTGSVASVKGEDLQSQVTTSMDAALSGRAAGVMVTQNSGQPGGGVSIRIRGVSSFGDNEPLYVIDGVPMSGNAENTAAGFEWAGGGGGQTAVNALSGINTNDIESIEVLKDASATAIYGSRAANGVVLVTTKSGKAGKTNISYNTYFGVQTLPKQLDVLNLQEFASYIQDVDEAFGRETDPALKDPSILGKGTNWQDEIYQTANVQNHNISLTGGNEKTTFATSLSYMNQEGIIRGSGFERVTGKLNLRHKATDWLKLGATINLSQTNEDITLNDDVEGLVSLAIVQRPDIPVKNLDGSWGGPTSDQLITSLNPVAISSLKDLNLKRSKVFGNLSGDLRLHKNITFTSKLGYDVSLTNNYGFSSSYEMGDLVNNVNMGYRSATLNQFWLLSNYITYNKEFNSNLNLSLMLGQEAQQNVWENLSATRQDFISNTVQELNAGNAETATNGGQRNTASLTSYYGRGHVDLMNKYMLTATFRYDGSSKFAKGNKWGFFPSLAFAWKLNEEAFLKDLSNLDNLKLRVGYGEVGNQNIENYAYGVQLKNYETKWGVGLLPKNYSNPNLQWETTKSWNAGLDVNMFDNRIELIAEVYKKNTEDLLMDLPLPLYMGSSGFGSIESPIVNIGEMENKGVELTLNTVNTAGAVEWKTGITLTFNRNEIVNTSNQHLDGYVQWFDHITRSSQGMPIGQYYGYQVEGIFQNAEDIRNHATQSDKVDKNSGTWVGDLKFKDISGPDGVPDGVIDENDLTYIGDPNPDFTFGFNNTVKWKNFDLNLLLTGSIGNDVYNYTRMRSENMTGTENQLATVNNRARLELIDPNESADLVDNIQVSNPGATLPRITPSDPNQNNRVSDRYIEDGSYVRVKNLTIGYSLPQNLLDKINMTRARAYISFQNLYTFTNYSGYDPELGNYNQNPLLGGIDNGNYPQPRVYTVGLNVNF